MQITFIDRPCGSGKTQNTINSLDPETRYVVITPYLSEVERWREDAAKVGVHLHEPSDTETSKLEDFKQALELGLSIITTHTLFDMCKSVDLKGYELIIDEVFDVCESTYGPSRKEWETVYIGDGYATEDEEGLVTPTLKWHADPEGLHPTLRRHLYHLSCAGRLYRTAEGYFVSAVPLSLFTTAKKVTILTYQATSSLMAYYFTRFGLSYSVDRDTALDHHYRKQFKQLVTLKPIHALSTIDLGFGAQEKMRLPAGKKVVTALKSLKRNHLDGVSDNQIFLSCNKDNWLDSEGRPRGLFAKDSRLTKVHFVARTTKGTNNYRDCTHAIYLNDLHLSPNILGFLGLTKEQKEQWALSEFLQWAYRGSVRTGEHMTLFVASPRMMGLLEDHLEPTLSLIEAA